MNKKVVLLFGVFCIAAGLYAEPEQFTLTKTLEYAKKNSPKAKIIYKEKEILKDQSWQTFGVVLPILSVSNTDTTRKTPESPLSPPMATPSEIKTRTQTQTAVENFSLGSIAAVKAGFAASNLAEYSYQDALQSFELSVKKAFYDLTSAKNLLQINQQLAIQTATYYKNAQIMFDNNLISKKDLLDSKIRFLDSQQNLQTTQKFYQTALYGFNTTLGRAVTQDVQLATYNIVVDETILDKSFDLEQLAQYAIANKPGYRSFKETVLLTEADEWRAWGDSLPGLQATYVKQNNNSDPESSFSPNGDTEIKTLGVYWTFFAGGSNLWKIHEKANTADKMRETEKINQNMLVMDIQNCIEEIQLKTRNVLMAREQAAAAEESLKLATINFESGNGTSTQVNDSLVQMLGSSSNLIKAEYEYEYAKDRLNYAVGKNVL